MTKSEHPNDSYQWAKLVPELSVMEFEKSLKFYTDVLGFKVINQRANPKFAYLDKEGVQFMLEEYQQGDWNVAELEKPHGRGINFQIELDSIKDLYEKVEHLNIRLYRPLKEQWYDFNGRQEGQKEFWIQDPDGYLLRFVEYLGAKK